jgi:hypothetical protein
MKRRILEEMTVEELVERFVSIALAQGKAMRTDDNAIYNCLFREMNAVEDELARRSGDQRRALLPLLSHENAQIRLKSAIATLALAPEAARRTLQVISDQNEYPEAASARSMMDALDEGRFVPT